jgi:hypothetical protein
MSTSAVSSSSLNQQLQSYFQTRNSDVQQLGQALQSGNLASAQVAYNNITAIGQGGPFASGKAFISPQRQQDFNAVGQALQSGDLAGAQAAFATLKATANHGVNDPPVAGGTSTTNTGGSGPEIILNLSAASGTTANPEQITINVGQGSGGGEQLSVSVGQGSSAQQVSFNLNANSNEQIVLNLLGATASGTTTTGTTAGSSASGGLSVSA